MDFSFLWRHLRWQKFFITQKHSARISQVVGLEYDPTNYLLMHAMGPNVAGVIGSAVAAGILLGFLM